MNYFTVNSSIHQICPEDISVTVKIKQNYRNRIESPKIIVALKKLTQSDTTSNSKPA